MLSPGGIIRLALLGAYGYFCWLMLAITLQYWPIAPDVAFLRIKQDVVAIPYYLPAFFVHAFTALLVLPAGFTQFSAAFRRRWPSWHRRLGKVYLLVVLILAAPSGLLIGLHANGGWSSQWAFCLLAVLWFYFTWEAWRQARRRNWTAHRDFMIRGFALALSAITLRAWKYLLVALFHPHPMDVYRLVAWLGWVLNLLVAEFIIHHLNHRQK